MCGFTGWVDFRRNLSGEKGTIEKMTATLSKRGPDDTNFFVHNRVAFGHKRLVVVDPENGKQPMTRVKDGHAYTLIYNGELYNTEDIRKELVKRGHRFQGHSDTEVLLGPISNGKKIVLPILTEFSLLQYGMRNRNKFLSPGTAWG